MRGIVGTGSRGNLVHRMGQAASAHARGVDALVVRRSRGQLSCWRIRALWWPARKQLREHWH